MAARGDVGGVAAANAAVDAATADEVATRDRAAMHLVIGRTVGEEERESEAEASTLAMGVGRGSTRRDKRKTRRPTCPNSRASL
mmetsp:Transcript_15828/g.30047  ORF Transcript_15828/g.30047 Transcript_15828/m.30047 type:complete len:84 (-) Transcript_15828:356-607(-)